MNEFINFILESGISLSFFGILYYLFLGKETFFLQNRIFLFITLVFSMVLPFLHIRIYEAEIIELPEITVTPTVNYLYAFTSYSQGATKNLEQTICSSQILLWIYSSVAAGLLLRLLVKLVQIYNLKRKGTVHIIEGICVIITDDFITPFAFLNMIFIPKNLKQKEGYRQILLHEMEHVKQRHSYDILIIELLLILQWCNPFVWLLKRAIHENHEYLADKAVLKAGTKRGAYKLLLLSEYLGETIFIGSPFNYSLIKNRIKMMNKMKSHKIANLKYLFGLFIATGLLVGFALENKLVAKQTQAPVFEKPEEIKVKITPEGGLVFLGDKKQLQEILKILSAAKNDKMVVNLYDKKEDKAAKVVMMPEIQYKAIQQNGTEPIFIRAEKMPEYEGGVKALLQFIGKNIQYPKEASEKGIQGRVFLKFVVEKDGSIGEVICLRSPDELLKQEAIRVVKSVPKFSQPAMQRGKAVRCWYQLPVTFRLGEKAYNYDEVEQKPEFEGGKKALLKFIGKNMEYPQEAAKKRITGKVELAFLVDKDGTIKNIVVKTSPDLLLTKEAIRIIKKLPRFKPAMEKGKAVKAWHPISIGFSLE